MTDLNQKTTAPDKPPLALPVTPCAGKSAVTP